MAKPEAGAGATLPVLVVRGSHADLAVLTSSGSGADRARREAGPGGLLRAGDDRGRGAGGTSPTWRAAARIYPGYLTEPGGDGGWRRSPFRRPLPAQLLRGLPSRAAPRRPLMEERVPSKDPAELAVANDPAAVAATPADGCTSVASRGAGAWWWAHRRLHPKPSGASTSSTPRSTRRRWRREGDPALNYAQTLPAAPPVNEAGLIVPIDALPDPDRRVGAPRHMVSPGVTGPLPRSTLASTTCSRRSARGLELPPVQWGADRGRGGHGDAPAVHEAGPSGAYAHANHYLDPVLAADSGDPRPNSITRLSRALELVTPGMDLARMKALLSDKQHSPDSICRDRTVAAFVADTAPARCRSAGGSRTAPPGLPTATERGKAQAPPGRGRWAPDGPAGQHQGRHGEGKHGGRQERSPGRRRSGLPAARCRPPRRRHPGSRRRRRRRRRRPARRGWWRPPPAPSRGEEEPETEAEEGHRAVHRAGGAAEAEPEQGCPDQGQSAGQGGRRPSRLAR